MVITREKLQQMALRPFYWFNLEIFIATFSLFITVTLLGLITINLSFLDPVSKSLSDFNFSDLLYSKLGTRSDLMDTNIILVNIGHLDRAGIAAQIRIIKAQHPKVVGFDGFFPHMRDPETDSVLREAFLAPPGMIMACFLTGKNEVSGEFDSVEVSNPYFTEEGRGFVNLGGVDPMTSTIRKFSPREVLRGETLYAMGAQLVRAYDPGAFGRLISRGNQREIIHYKGNRNAFICFDVDDLFDTLQDLSIMRDKIILMGYIGESFQSPPDLEDIYFTPMNSEISGRSWPDMYGVMIHANIVSMILSDDYINIMPLWLTILVSFVFCYFYILFASWFNSRHPFGYKVSFTIILLLLNVLIIYLFFLLYHHAHYSIHSGYFMAPILLYPTFLTYYERITIFLHRRYGIKSIFIPK